MKRDISDLDFRLLSAFERLMAERNVTRAAEKLSITQQGLSGQLSRLRQFFDDPLFVRDGYGVAPTPRAIVLSKPISAVLANLRGLAEQPQFDPASFEGPVAIAASDYAMALLLPPVLEQIRHEAPRLRLTVLPVDAATLAREFEEDRIDLALTVPEFTPKGLRIKELFTETYLAAVGNRHALAGREVDVEAFCAFDHLLVAPYRGDSHGPADRALKAIGKQRRIGMVVPNFAVVAALLDASDLIAVLPARLLEPLDERLFRFAPPVAVEGFTLAAVWSARRDFDPMHRWLLRAVANSASSLAGSSA